MGVFRLQGNKQVSREKPLGLEKKGRGEFPRPDWLQGTAFPAPCGLPLLDLCTFEAVGGDTMLGDVEALNLFLLVDPHAYHHPDD